MKALKLFSMMWVLTERHTTFTEKKKRMAAHFQCFWYCSSLIKEKDLGQWGGGGGGLRERRFQPRFGLTIVGMSIQSADH